MAEKTTRRKGESVFEQKLSYQKRQKQRRLKAQRRRAALVLFLIAALVAVLLFLTPIFNIRSVSVEGNQTVSEEQFTETLRPLIGENILRTGTGKIRKMLKTIPYIDQVAVQKKMIPPSVKVYVTEYTPAALIRAEGRNVIINSSLQVLQDAGELPWYVPTVIGIDVESAEIGSRAVIGTDSKAETLVTMLKTLESAQILDKVIEIDLNSLSYILMNYDDRIEVRCGSQLDMERKLRLFREAVMSNSLAENARGTLDLSETGKAVYTP